MLPRAASSWQLTGSGTTSSARSAYTAYTARFAGSPNSTDTANSTRFPSSARVIVLDAQGDDGLPGVAGTGDDDRLVVERVDDVPAQAERLHKADDGLLDTALLRHLLAVCRPNTGGGPISSVIPSSTSRLPSRMPRLRNSSTMPGPNAA